MQEIADEMSQKFHTTVPRSSIQNMIMRAKTGGSKYGRLYDEWADEKFGQEPPPEEAKDQLLAGPGSLASFGQDQDGEIYMLSLNGRIYRFVETPNEPFPTDFPTTLSATGCFQNTAAANPEFTLARKP